MFGKHLVHIVYQTGAKYDLNLVARHENTFRQVDILDRFQVCQIIVVQNDSQARCTVGHTLDILPAADESRKLYGDFFISLPLIRIHSMLLLFFSAKASRLSCGHSVKTIY